jgi:hypothetical protein
LGYAQAPFHADSAGKCQPTQFGRALEQLGITFIAARSPQAKGRVERLWGVLQDRLTSELRLAQASDLNSANAVLPLFMTDYNRRFAPRSARNASRVAPAAGKSGPYLLLRMDVDFGSGKAEALSLLGDLEALALPCTMISSLTTRGWFKLSTGPSRSTTAIPACNTPWLRQGDIFMLPLG